MSEQEQAALNTDRELWREREGDYYADSIHVTEGGGIGINCGGLVIVKSLSEWHALAVLPAAAPPLPRRSATAAVRERGASAERPEYTLELEEPRCESCGKGEGWTIVDSEGTGNGVTYYDKDGAEEVCADWNAAFDRGRDSVKPLLLELFLAGREEADAQSEAALLTPNSTYDESEASKARCLAAERRLEAAEEAAEFLLAVELGEHHEKETAEVEREMDAATAAEKEAERWDATHPQW